MVELYRQMGQLTAFLVMPDNTVLGGNHGIDAVTELGLKAKVIPVDFIQEGDEWFFVNDGEVVRHTSYKTKEEGMLKVSIAHNERFSYYDSDALGNLTGNLNFDVGEFSFDFGDQQPLEKLLAAEPVIAPAEPKSKEVECPSCHEKFTP